MKGYLVSLSLMPPRSLFLGHRNNFLPCLQRQVSESISGCSPHPRGGAVLLSGKHSPVRGPLGKGAPGTAPL